MAEGYNFFEGSQTDINRRLLRKIQALEEATVTTEVSALTARVKVLEEATGTTDVSALTARVKVLEDALGEYEDENTIAERLTALETSS